MRVASSAFAGGTGFDTSDTMPSLDCLGFLMTFLGLLGAFTDTLSSFSATSGVTSGITGALHSVLTSIRGEIISIFCDLAVAADVEETNDSNS